MQQATHPVEPAASPEPRASTDSLRQAYAVAGRVMGELTTLPRDIELQRQLDGEYRVQVFWSHDVSSVAALAAWADHTVTLTPSETGTGTYAETRPRIGGIEVWAWTLLSKAEAADAELLLVPRPDLVTDPVTADPDTISMLAAPAVMPLSSSPTANVPAATAPTADGEQ